MRPDVTKPWKTEAARNRLTLCAGCSAEVILMAVVHHDPIPAWLVESTEVAGWRTPAVPPLRHGSTEICLRTRRTRARLFPSAIQTNRCCDACAKPDRGSRGVDCTQSRRSVRGLLHSSRGLVDLLPEKAAQGEDPIRGWLALAADFVPDWTRLSSAGICLDAAFAL